MGQGTQVGIAAPPDRGLRPLLAALMSAPRLLDPEWDIVLATDDTCGERAYVKTYLPSREATIMVCPTRDVRPMATACHEVVHILLQRVQDAAQRIIEQLPEELRRFAQETWTEAHEETTEDVARAFRRAYGDGTAEGRTK